jgi:hypothetical protein
MAAGRLASPFAMLVIAPTRAFTPTRSPDAADY